MGSAEEQIAYLELISTALLRILGKGKSVVLDVDTMKNLLPENAKAISVLSRAGEIDSFVLNNAREDLCGRINLSNISVTHNE